MFCYHLNRDIESTQETNQLKQANPFRGQPESSGNVLNGSPKEAEDHHQIFGKSQGQIQNISNQSRGQKEDSVYIHQANRITSGELKITTHQNPNFQGGISSTSQKKITSQIIRKVAAANTVPRNLEISQSSTSSKPHPPFS